MTNERWPTDKRFRAFAALLADGVLFASRRGALIGDARRNLACMCPEGCALLMLGCNIAAPMARDFARYTRPEFARLARPFASGFDGESARRLRPTSLARAAYRLGQEYRRKYVEAQQ